MKTKATKTQKPTRPSLQSKICPACNRPFTNRKKWESRGMWDQIVYCSDACRARKTLA